MSESKVRTESACMERVYNFAAGPGVLPEPVLEEIRDEMMNYQATFKNILSGMGTMSTEMTEQISESLVKMGLDYSSLFNVKQGTAMSKFQSALTGSIVPIRKDSGYDVSDLTVVAKARSLGIERSSAQLSQVEKRLLKIILLQEEKFKKYF